MLATEASRIESQSLDITIDSRKIINLTFVASDKRVNCIDPLWGTAFPNVIEETFVWLTDDVNHWQRRTNTYMNPRQPFKLWLVIPMNHLEQEQLQVCNHFTGIGLRQCVIFILQYLCPKCQIRTNQNRPFTENCTGSRAITQSIRIHHDLECRSRWHLSATSTKDKLFNVSVGGRLLDWVGWPNVTPRSKFSKPWDLGTLMGNHIRGTRIHNNHPLDIEEKK